MHLKTTLKSLANRKQVWVFYRIFSEMGQFGVAILWVASELYLYERIILFSRFDDESLVNVLWAALGIVWRRNRIRSNDTIEWCENILQIFVVVITRFEFLCGLVCVKRIPTKFLYYFWKMLQYLIYVPTNKQNERLIR